MGGVEFEADGEIVDAFGAAGGEDAAQDGEGVGTLPGVAEAVHGGDDAGGVEGLPVVEGDVGAEREGPDGAVGVRGPGEGEAGAEDEIGAVEEKEFAGLAEQGEAADFGDGHGVDGAGGDLAGDADSGTRFALGGLCRSGDGGEEADTGGVMEELSAIDLAGTVLFRNVAGELAHRDVPGGLGGQASAPPILLFSHPFRASPYLPRLVEGDQMPFRHEAMFYSGTASVRLSCLSTTLVVNFRTFWFSDIMASASASNSSIVSVTMTRV